MTVRRIEAMVSLSFLCVKKETSCSWKYTKNDAIYWIIRHISCIIK